MLWKEWTVDVSLHDHQQVSLSVRWTFALFQHSDNIGSEVEGGQEKRWHVSAYLDTSWSCFAEVSGTKNPITMINISPLLNFTNYVNYLSIFSRLPVHICNLHMPLNNMERIRFWLITNWIFYNQTLKNNVIKTSGTTYSLCCSLFIGWCWAFASKNLLDSPVSTHECREEGGVGGGWELQHCIWTAVSATSSSRCGRVQ